METLDAVMKMKPKEAKPTSYEQAFEVCMQYFDGDELAATTWLNKYAMKNKEGQFLEGTPDEMHQRMAKAFHRVEAKYSSNPIAPSDFLNLSEYGQKRKSLSEKDIYQFFKNFKYIIPQGSVMAVLDNPYIVGSLSNCVVLPEIFDSYGGILHTDQQLVQLFKRRCGVGIDISSLRPEGVSVANAAGTTSGAVSFMERFSNTTREVGQKGRRGALMITMDVAHPDIEKFITIKQDLSKVTGANISVRLSDAFMQAVFEQKKFVLQWPLDSTAPKVKKTIAAADLWKKIVQCAHQTAEPGIIFWDRQHQYSTSSLYPGFKNTSTNPCSEIAMQGGDSCRLIALNLLSFVTHPYTESATFDFEKFYKITYEAQRLMDDLVDLELESIERIIAKIEEDHEPSYIKQCELETWKLLYENGKKGRRTGLGFTALADALAALSLKFDEDKSLSFIEQMMRTKCSAEFDSSIDMAIERGAFENFDTHIENQSLWVQMMQQNFETTYQRMMQHGRRNISISTVAPTGTLSMMAQTSSGIEPVFMLSYKRRKKINPEDTHVVTDFKDELGDCWQEFEVHHLGLKKWMEAHPNEPLENSPYFGATAAEINWTKRLEIQAIVQRYTTHSISSTINLPENTSIERVAEIYEMAWRMGLKGITVYRENSRNGVLVAHQDKENDDVWKDHVAPPRPKILDAEIIRFQNNHEKWIAFIGILNNRPYEIFTGKSDDTFLIPDKIVQGKIIKNKDENQVSRYDFQYTDKDNYKTTIEGLSRTFNPEFWNYAKLLSGVLRHGMPIVQVVDLIEKLNLDSASINTWKKGVVRALKKFIPEGTVSADKKCPECKDQTGLIFEEGCLKCKSCGYAKCG